MATTSRYYDGDYAVGFYDGPPLITYPFLNNTTPDRYAKQIRRTWLQRGVDYVPTNADRTSWTNMLWPSEDFMTGWSTGGSATIIANTTANPMDGTVTASTVFETVANSQHYLARSLTLSASTYTYSAIVKPNGRDWVYFGVIDSAATAHFAFFNVSTGVAGTSLNATAATPVYVGNGFYRIAVTFTAAAGSADAYIQTSTDGATITYAGSTSLGLYIWGADVKTGSVAGPYVSTTTEARTISAPPLDPGDEINEADPFAYLVAESEQNREIADTVKVSRLFSRIPATQTRPTSLRISKPSVPGVVEFGDYRLNKPDDQLEIYDAYGAQTVTGDSGAPALYPTGGTYTLTFDGYTTGAIAYNASAATVKTALDALTSVSNRGGLVAVSDSYNTPNGLVAEFQNYSAATLSVSISAPTYGYYVNQINNGYIQVVTIESNSGPITSGTFTITIFTQTTAAIAYNASAATVQSALNALSEVSNRGVLTVTAPDSANIYDSIYERINFTMTFANPLITANTSSLTPVGSTITASFYAISGGKQQALRFSAGLTSTRTISCDSHGITTADTIFIKGSFYYYDITNFTIPDANNITLNITPSLAYYNSSTILEVGKRTKADYTPGSGTIRASASTSFYLPGVTAGIDNAGNVPQVSDQGDQTPFLLATFAGTGTINMNVGQLQPWNGTTILSQEITTINAADV